MITVISTGGNTIDWNATYVAPTWTAIDRPANRIVPGRLTLTLDGDDSFEFHQVAWGQDPSYSANTRIQVTIDGTVCFSGVITQVKSNFTGNGWTHLYLCMGLSYLAKKIPVTNPQDGSGIINYNIPPDSPDFVQQYAGMSVGAIITAVLNDHMAFLNTVGVTGFSSTDLAALTIVPPVQITVQGESMLNFLAQFLENWSPQYYLYIQPDGTIRCVNLFGFAAATLTEGSDPIDPPDLSASISDCATRVILRGSGIIEPAYVSLSDGTLAPAWDSTDQSNWNLYDFSQPTGGISDGTVVSGSLTATTCTLQPTSTTEDWPANFWSTNEGWLALVNPVATGLTQMETRPFSGSGASSSAGSSFTAQWATPLVNGGYTEYHAWAQPPGLSDVWRLYNITYNGAPGVTSTNDFTNPYPSYIAQHLVKRSPVPMPFRPQGGAVVLTNYPYAVICWSSSGSPPYIEFPATFEVMPESYQVRFTQPVVTEFGTTSALETGGSSTNGIPSDIKMLLFYSRGPLEAFAPANGGGKITSIAVGSGGSSYTSAPEVVIFGDGTGATATATITSGAVSAVTVTNEGAGYTTATISFLGGGGSGATATATISPVTPSYSGSANAQYGLERTLIVDCPEWYSGSIGVASQSTADMAALAQQYLNTTQNTIIEGTITYQGLYSTALNAFTNSTFGVAFNIAGNGFTTGWESAAAPLKEVSIDWPQQGAAAFLTTMHVSTRRRPFTGDRMFIHPIFTGGSYYGESGGSGKMAFEGTMFDDFYATSGGLTDAQTASLGGSADLGPLAAAMFGTNNGGTYGGSGTENPTVGNEAGNSGGASPDAPSEPGPEQPAAGGDNPAWAMMNDLGFFE